EFCKTHREGLSLTHVDPTLATSPRHPLDRDHFEGEAIVHRREDEALGSSPQPFRSFTASCWDSGRPGSGAKNRDRTGKAHWSFSRVAGPTTRCSFSPLERSVATEHHGSPPTSARSGLLPSGTVIRPLRTAAKTFGPTSRWITLGRPPGHSTISTGTSRF